MNRIKAGFLVTLFVLFSANNLTAQSTPSQPSVKSSFYAGGQMGGSRLYGKRVFEGSDLITGLTFELDQGKPNSGMRFTFGLFVGYHHPLSERFALGVETYFNHTPSIKDYKSKSIQGIQESAEIRTTWNAGLNIKPGFSMVRNSIFLYPLAGIELGRFKYFWQEETDPHMKAKKTLFGWNLGVGIQKHFEKCHVGLELKQTFYKTKIFSVRDEDASYSGKKVPRIFSLMLRVAIPFGGK